MKHFGGFEMPYDIDRDYKLRSFGKKLYVLEEGEEHEIDRQGLPIPRSWTEDDKAANRKLLANNSRLRPPENR